MWYKDEIPAKADNFLDMLQDALGLEHIRVEKWEFSGGTGWDTDDTTLYFDYVEKRGGNDKPVRVEVDMRAICGNREAWMKINGKLRKFYGLGLDRLVKQTAEAIMKEWKKNNSNDMKEAI